MVYVIDRNGQPLMPTDRYGKVRRLLRDKLAIIVRQCPFTIQLLYETATHVVQPVIVGDDSGSQHNGISAVALYSPSGEQPKGDSKPSEGESGNPSEPRAREVYASEVEMRTDVTKKLAARRELRRGRRYRKTRYRKKRFLNRVKSKHKKWLAPSIENKINTHLRELRLVCSILPVSKIIIEVASFDLQKLKADMLGLERPTGKEYQEGEQFGFWNAREYVLFRDNHVCRCCKGKSGDKRLNVHHIESRQTGGDAPNNLITLCETCHTGYHKGVIKLPSDIQRGASFRDAAAMGIMRWTFYNRCKKEYEPKGITVKRTFGYLTKNTRIQNGLEKTHCTDARCITGYPQAEPLKEYYYKRKVRCHNRQLHKLNPIKGGIRKANQTPKELYGFRLFDRVRYQNTICFLFGRRASGYFDIRKLDGTRIHDSVHYKKLKLLEHCNSILTERRAISSHD